jgi:predicted nuclease of predicted toxin-antitoxin system
VRFLIDNALSPVVAERLRLAGHDVLHVRERGMHAATDEAVLAFARTDNRVVVSADTDFGSQLALTGRADPSVVLLRRGTDRRPHRQAAIIIANLERLEEPLRQGCVAVLEEGRLRIRGLPMGSG